MRENKDWFKGFLEENPIIAAIKDDDGLQKVVKSDCKIVFVLYGSLCTIQKIVHQLKDEGKMVFVHADLMEGTSCKEVVIDFIKETTSADGIISTKMSLLKAAKAKGLFTVHRFFLIDSISYHNIPKMVAASNPDVVEVMPGYSPKGIRWVLELVPDYPLIASGLVCQKEDVVGALGAGAAAISSTCFNVWDNI